MTDWRALCAELAEALDHNRQCLLDDRRLTHPLADKARAVLARWGHQPAPPTEGEQRHPTPVPVSERLPGPEDLNDKGECWEWDPTSDAWVLIRPNGLVFRPGPWLPAHALPLPAGEGEK